MLPKCNRQHSEKAFPECNRQHLKLTNGPRVSVVRALGNTRERLSINQQKAIFDEKLSKAPFLLNVMTGVSTIPVGSADCLTENCLRWLVGHCAHKSDKLCFVVVFEFCSVCTQSHLTFLFPHQSVKTSDWSIILRELLTRTWLANTPQSKACKAVCSLYVKNDNNDTHVFVTASDWIVTHLSPISVSFHRPLTGTHLCQRQWLLVYTLNYKRFIINWLINKLR